MGSGISRAMPKHYRKPKGFELDIHPLHHNFEYDIAMDVHTTVDQNCTFLTFMYTANGRSGRITPDNIEVHPMHTNYAEETGPLCNYMSIMDNFGANVKISLTKGALTTNSIKVMRVYIGFYRMAFEDVHNKTDIATTDSVDDILKIITNTTDRDSIIDFDAVDLSVGTQPVSTINDAEGFAEYGLGTDLKMENVLFSPDKYFNSQRFYSNGKFVRGVLPKLIPLDLTLNKPYRNIFVKNIPSTCRRGNDHMMWGMLIYIPQGVDIGQYFRNTDVTDIDHLNVRATVRYLEWNPNHIQAEAGT